MSARPFPPAARSEHVETHQKSGEKSPARGDAEQSDVNAVRNRVGRRVPRDAEFDGGTENPTQVEEHPKDAKVSTLGPFGGVGQRQTPLRGPQEGRAATEDGATRHHETGVAVNVVREQGAHVNCAASRQGKLLPDKVSELLFEKGLTRVSGRSDGEGDSITYSIHDSACRNAKHSERAVQGNVGIVGGFRVELPSAENEASSADRFIKKRRLMRRIGEKGAYPPPIPEFALKIPGVQKQMKEMMMTWTSGLASLRASGPRGGSGGSSSDLATSSAVCPIPERLG